MSKNLEQRIEAIEHRNKRVELDKAWETSLIRRISVTILTYFSIAIFMIVADIERPFINAVIPTVGFLLSTLTISYLKNWWINQQ